ncbi:hypothetical protein ACFL5Z_09515 [Planctomycetota bacterium]
MNTQVWMELAEQFEKELSFYNSSSEESDIARLRPHLKKAGKAYFEFLQNDDPDITTTGDFLVEPVVRDVMDSSGREHHFTDAHDLYWICVLGLHGRCGHIVVKSKKLLGMRIPVSHTSSGPKVDWPGYFLGYVIPEWDYLLNERDYIINVCEASIQVCTLLIDDYGDIAEKPTSTKHETTSVSKTPKKGKGKDKQSERKYKPWTKPGNACFIIHYKDNVRLLFYHEEKQEEKREDLCLKSNTQTLELMVMLAKGNVHSEEIKARFSLKTTKSSKVVSRANKKLNERISKKGFTEVPQNTEFIKRDEYNCYRCTLKIFESLDDFDRKQMEPVLVDDRGFPEEDESWD